MAQDQRLPNGNADNSSAVTGAMFDHGVTKRLLAPTAYVGGNPYVESSVLERRRQAYAAQAAEHRRQALAVSERRRLAALASRAGIDPQSQWSKVMAALDQVRDALDGTRMHLGWAAAFVVGVLLLAMVMSL